MKTELLSTNQRENATLTMSSREIADICGKRHDHVMADIRKMLDELNLNAPDFSGTFKTAQGNEYQCFFLPKREVMILVSGYRIDLRAKIIDRLEELENQQKLPSNYLQALKALVESEEEEKQTLLLENQTMKPKADFVDHYVEVGTSKSLRETAKILNFPEKMMIECLLRDRVLYRQSGNLLPYQTVHSKELFTVKTGTAEHGHNFTQTRVTGKGIEWIAQRYASELGL
ncbi:phage antirepressor KilAC domain-containing protein [Glaesserella parasuis]|uniref:Phage regulatory protein/antirepressor Ant n=2 Tax=Glaesserella parasuis TaxID=738 RepID=A0AAJ6AAT2_GLAPU|nr:phage regulatory protein/antirepressor Ant [Glaesserella parasuis]MDG6808424.1 phage regulatory protein/antirepressor Ant [Glaesserella parasuis]MDO9811946.1 phage regulatory protein/antirepressor Ant [Glaesserella parasuis]MDO9837935.1 phage regulatory protein/antirepressor Ant [Glaesserella parasuis]MDO9846510.1 phage regulatory protein/antirepressor Ant [Glaesserella parasuis]MDO9888626.1 phage regulatory protein/antirepressor Ant [Glaesserella parasuis]